MAQIIVNKIAHNGSTINIVRATNGDIVGRNIIIDGNVVTHVELGQKIEITVEGGSIHSLTADGNVEVFGNIDGKVVADGNVEVGGSVAQDIDADGNVSVTGDVGGNVVADGNVKVGGSLAGNIRASGNVSVGKR